MALVRVCPASSYTLYETIRVPSVQICEASPAARGRWDSKPNRVSTETAGMRLRATDSVQACRTWCDERGGGDFLDETRRHSLRLIE